MKVSRRNFVLAADENELFIQVGGKSPHPNPPPQAGEGMKTTALFSSLPRSTGEGREGACPQLGDHS